MYSVVSEPVLRWTAVRRIAQDDETVGDYVLRELHQTAPPFHPFLAGKHARPDRAEPQGVGGQQQILDGCRGIDHPVAGRLLQ